MEHQVLDATVRCIARVGVAKTTLDDVARQAGCARATVYRYFPGKQPLLHAAVAREADRLGAEALIAAADAHDLGEAATAVLATGARFVIEHEALRAVLTVEPEVLLPYVSFARGDRMLAAAADRLAPAFDRFLDRDQALRLSEWLVRLAFSYLCTPEESELLDPVRVRDLVTDFVLPGLERPVPTEGIHA